jgi:hypothetical protein
MIAQCANKYGICSNKDELPADSVTVERICGSCGGTRQSFYLPADKAVSWRSFRLHHRELERGDLIIAGTWGGPGIGWDRIEFGKYTGDPSGGPATHFMRLLPPPKFE